LSAAAPRSARDGVTCRPAFWLFGGFLRQRRNVRDMAKTLHRIKDVAET
jgi:hypothetical protein